MTEQFVDLLSTWGLSVLIIAGGAFGVTALVKRPIKKLAVKLYGESGKKKLTAWIVFIPVILCFVGALSDVWIRVHTWSAPFVAGFDWSRVIRLMLASMGIPALITAFIENFQEAHDNALVAKLTEGTAEEKAEKDAEAYRLAKANAQLNRDAEAQRKAEEAQKKAEAKIARINAQKEAKLAALQKEMDALKAQQEKLTVKTVESDPKEVHEEDGHTVAL